MENGKEASSDAQKKPYTVVFESFTQEKKQLRTLVSYSEEAPNGYTFVPIGVPDLTEYCKDISRQRDLDVYIVSAAATSKFQKNPGNISHHIYRIGHHFENGIVEKACQLYGPRSRVRQSTLGDRERTLRNSTLTESLEQLEEHLDGQATTGVSQQLHRQICETTKELFPDGPEEILNEVVERAFQEGTERVGNAKDLPLSRKIQLAVLSYIRHERTNYDFLLHGGIPRPRAREIVENRCVIIMKDWMGDASTGKAEDILREVIVIGDDSDDDDDDVEILAQERGRSASLEIVSTRRADGQGGFKDPRHIRHYQGCVISVKPRRTLQPPTFVSQKEEAHTREERQGAISERNHFHPNSLDRQPAALVDPQRTLSTRTASLQNTSNGHPFSSNLNKDIAPLSRQPRGPESSQKPFFVADIAPSFNHTGRPTQHRVAPGHEEKILQSIEVSPRGPQKFLNVVASQNIKRRSVTDLAGRNQGSSFVLDRPEVFPKRQRIDNNLIAMPSQDIHDTSQTTLELPLRNCRDPQMIRDRSASPQDLPRATNAARVREANPFRSVPYSTAISNTATSNDVPVRAGHRHEHFGAGSLNEYMQYRLSSSVKDSQQRVPYRSSWPNGERLGQHNTGPDNWQSPHSRTTSRR